MGALIAIAVRDLWIATDSTLRYPTSYAISRACNFIAQEHCEAKKGAFLSRMFLMQIYLPIAEFSVDLIVIIALGGLVGFVAGMFGGGGAFLLTPLLIFVGIPPPVAVATVTNQIVGASVSGVLAHWRRQSIDFRMGFILLGGGLVGATCGVWLYGLLRRIGQIDLVISLSYVVLLGLVGSLMMVEAVGASLKRHHYSRPIRRRQPNWVRRLPFKMRFMASHLYLSALLPLGAGFAIGILQSILGAGGGFLIIPVLLYIMAMPATMVAGTSLFPIIFVSANVTILQAVTHQTVDIVLAAILMGGSVVGAQYGTRFGARLPVEHLRVGHALIILAVCGKMLFDLVTPPSDVYSVSVRDSYAEEQDKSRPRQTVLPPDSRPRSGHSVGD